MLSGWVARRSGTDILAPAVDLLNENPSLVAFGNQLSPPTPPGISSKALTGTFSGPLKPVPAHQDKQILLYGWLYGCCMDAVRMAGGKDISDPAVDLHNENPSLVALGNQETYKNYENTGTAT